MDRRDRNRGAPYRSEPLARRPAGACRVGAVHAAVGSEGLKPSSHAHRGPPVLLTGVSFKPNKKLIDGVERAALALLGRDGRITYPTLLLELGILSAQDLDAWRCGRVPFLERVTRANLTKLARIQTAVRRLARAHGLTRRIVQAPRGRHYSKSGHPFVEEEYHAVYIRRGRTADEDRAEDRRRAIGGPARARVGPC